MTQQYKCIYNWNKRNVTQLDINSIKVADTGVIIVRNKIAGAIYGMALGDSMGMPSELWGREKVRKYFGKI